ncbi:MAG: acetyl-CoA acetyltransferase [Tepidiforma sp.]|jgi:acetyl-CoA C-acetyltransferase|uniref:thiolase family protein n=1 Tax=Tepidiforma sp. TaxID=2682230 RepID=UPI0021DE6712|nr:thiolase family protein [Tepidiforma sp.]GIW14373.1 MAG: acetyl-CoA acetyltransferase [Tepidiforma sp.]
MPAAFIYDATRTPWGKFGGALKEYPASELAALLIRTLVQRNRLDPAAIDNVILGQVLQAGAGQLPSRQALIHAGLPVSTPSTLVNKVCGSGMRAVTLGASLIQLGDADLVLAGGMESMSNVPYYDVDTRWGARMGNRTLVDGMVYDGLWCAFDDVHMANQADDMAARREISREEMDAWSVRSQRRWGAAFEAGHFDREITPVPNRRDPNHIALDRDESPRPNSTVERLARIPTVYGTRAITAGNAPGTNDGAAVLLIGSEAAGRRHGLTPLARIAGWAESATRPAEYPVASALALRRLAEKTRLAIDDFDIIEVNEAFACVPLICGQELGWDPDRVNRWGGSVAMGHPIGASGARLVLTAAYQLQESGARYAAAAICSGTGQGDAILLERV